MKSLFSIVLTLVCCSFAYSASFNCSLDRLSNVEKLICDNPEISVLDDQLSEWYLLHRYSGFGSQFQHLNPGLKESQRNWITSRNSCSTVTCLKDAYDDRVLELKESYINYQKFSSEPYVENILRNASDKPSYSKVEMDELISFILDEDGIGHYLVSSYESYGGNPNGYCGGGAYIGYWYIEVDTENQEITSKDSVIYGDCGGNAASLSYVIESDMPIIIRMYVKKSYEDQPVEHFSYRINYEGKSSFIRLVDEQ